MNSNEVSADSVRDLTVEFGHRTGLDPHVEDAPTLVGDLICSLLHLATIEGADWREVVGQGIWHFRTSTVWGDVAETELPTNSHVNRCKLASELDISYEEASRRLGVADATTLSKALDADTSTDEPVTEPTPAQVRLEALRARVEASRNDEHWYAKQQ
jgi:hypothetical protein